MRSLSDYFSANPGAHKQIESFAELRGVCDQLEASDYIFRGLASSSYGLKTTFERSFYGWYPFENKLLLGFQARMHQFLRHEELPSTRLELLATMQHHGVPTRLLDFTRSFYVASYFACRDQLRNESCAIIAVRANDVMRQTIFSLKADGVEVPDFRSANGKYDYTRIGSYFMNESVFNDVVASNKYSGIGIADPFKQNLRLSVQQGLFLYSFRLNQPFEHSFMELMDPVIKAHNESNGEDITLCMFEIPGRLRGDILRELRRMNISAETLFGGLDGFALALKEDMESRRSM